MLRYQLQASLGRKVEQRAVAEALDVSGTAVSKWESGEVYPTLENLEALARFYGVHPGWLAFGWEPQRGTAPTPTPAAVAAAARAADQHRRDERPETG